MPEEKCKRGGRDSLKEVQRAELAAATRRLDTGNHCGDGECGNDLSGDEDGRNGERAVGVVEDGDRQSDCADPCAKSVDRVGADDSAQATGLRRRWHAATLPPAFYGIERCTFDRDSPARR